MWYHRLLSALLHNILYTVLVCRMLYTRGASAVVVCSLSLEFESWKPVLNDTQVRQHLSRVSDVRVRGLT